MRPRSNPISVFLPVASVLKAQVLCWCAGANCLRRMVLDYGYNPLAAVTRSRNAAWNVPKAHLIEFGLVFEV